MFGDAPVVMPPAPVAVPQAQREVFAGRYALATGGSVTVRATADGLEAEADDPALLGAFPVLTAPGGRFADLESKTMAILEASAKDDFRPLFDAFSDERPFEVVQGNQRRFWGGWRTQFGEFKRLELIGTGMAQGDPAVTVRLQFERGGPAVQLIWGPRRLAGFRVMPPAAPTAFVAESPTAWVSFTYRAPALLRLTFGDKGALEIESSKGQLRATKQ